MSIRYFILLLFVSGTIFAQKDLSFTPNSGAHERLKEVIITYPSKGKLFYTTNGEQPTKGSSQLEGEKLRLKRNTAFRFLYIDPKGKEHQFSKTYIVNRKFDLPIFSIITDSSNLFDVNTGIYSKGCCADTVEPYKGANFWKNWERETQIAYITENNEQVIDQKAGIQMFGGFSLGMPQKSFGLYARKKYGSNRFEHSFFHNRPFEEYKNLVLRNAGSDMQGAHIRDAFASTLVESTGLLVQAYRPVAVYINGVYWGKYNLREKINEHFINQHFGYETDSLIIMRHENSAQYGSNEEYKLFWNRLKELNLSKKKELEFVASKIDIDNYLLYNTCEVYTGNADAGGNIRYYKHTSDTAKWRYIFYDVDHSMNIFKEKAHLKNSVKHFTTENKRDWPHPNWSTLLIRKLLENDSIRDLYIQRFCDQLNTTFRSDRALKVLDSLKNEVNNESVFHKKRWRVTDEIYKLSFDKLYNYIQKRPDILFDQLRRRFDLDGLTTVKIKKCKGGKVKVNSIIIKDSFKGSYFKDIPILLEAKADFEYEFVGWKELQNTSKVIDTTLKKELILTPVFKKRSISKYRNKVIINEIDAEQDSSRDSDYLEILNLTSETIDLKNWLISDGKNIFSINRSLRLDGGKYLVITEKKEVFKKAYSVENLVGHLGFGISKKGEVVTIYDKDSLLVDRVSTLNWKKEKNNKNWSRVSLNRDHKFFNSWVLENPTPGKKNEYCNELNKYREKTHNFGFWLIVAGIIFFVFGLGVVLIIFKRSN